MACALLGFADDYTKIIKRRSLGLRARTKLGVTIAISIGLWWIATAQANLAETLRFRLIDYQIDLSVLGGHPVPAAHLPRRRGDDERGQPDRRPRRPRRRLRGDRRCSPTSGSRTSRPASTTSRCSPRCVVGACIGFLWFNAFPATIFMGDTGSLGLGGAIAGLAVMTKTELLLILLGGIFVVEALSVLIQVFRFQTFRKRVFLMAPIHHHFELMAWSETKIILRFWIIAAICSAIGFTLYQQSIT